jgi:two-component system alkaline phosphatase synthesis response regulator PhoP
VDPQIKAREMISRVKAVLRRAEETDDLVYSVPNIILNIKAHQITVNNTPVEVTLKEFELLRLLMKNAGTVLTRDMLLENIWGYGFDGETRTVDVHIGTLRSKLGVAGEIIETVRGIGYRIANE